MTVKPQEVGGTRRPLVVYLDSSDFINFSNPNSDGKYQDVFAYLVRKVDEGILQLPFSMLHVFELIQDFDKAHLDSRVGRARMVMKLSKGNAFRYPPNSFVDPISPTGNWFPDMDIASRLRPEVLKSEILERLDKEFISRNTPRKQRRLARKLKLADLAKHIPDVGESKVSEVQYLPEKLRRGSIFRDLLLGSVSPDEVAVEIEKVFCDLELLVHAVSELLNGQVGITSQISQIFSSFIGPIQNAREAFGQAMALVEQLREGERELRSHVYVDHQLVREMKEARKKLLRSIGLINGDKIDHTDSDETPPGHAERTFAYVKFNIKNARKAQDSDIVDLMHSGHLHVVDLWRGDTWFCDTLIRQRVAGYEKIVAKIEDLPQRIDAKLAPF